MSETIDLVLSHLAASYNTPEQATATQAVVKAATKASKKQTPSNNGAKVQGVKSEPMLTIPVPAKGSLSAEGFIVAMRRARTRDESIQAIAGYVGYDPKETFGTQEYRAKAQAQREMKGEISSPSSGVRNVRQTVAGYVAGMPNLKAKKLADLHGRLNMAIDKSKEHRQLAKEALSESERSYQQTLAGVEDERIVAIQKEIDCLPANE